MTNAKRLKKGEAGGLYAQANALVEHVGLSVTKACKQVGLSVRTYYLHEKKKKAPAGTGAKRDTQEGISHFNSDVSTSPSATQSESAFQRRGGEHETHTVN